ncbi:MAG TPA: hypothetical protein DEQ47_04300 [Solibacterales bacterium]|jgi:hypothetical protein|nr:hypothetical protein [Bryobacterales bacterium]
MSGFFPQLSSGALTQFPMQRSRRKRSIANVLEDGTYYALADSGVSWLRWQLDYAALSDVEATTLAAFFEQNEGRAGSFLFMDPGANLLVQSETLENVAWVRNTLLTLRTGTADPLLTNRAATLTNTSPAALTIAQSMSLPGAATACFSVYGRCAAGGTVQLTRNDGASTVTQPFALRPEWQRIALRSVIAGGAGPCTFSLTIAAGYAVDIFGFQVTAQPAAGQYVATAAISALYPATAFDSDELAFRRTDYNQNSCQVRLISRA